MKIEGIGMWIFIVISTTIILLAIYFCFFKQKDNFMKVPDGYYLYSTSTVEDVRWAGDSIVHQTTLKFEFKTNLK